MSNGLEDFWKRPKNWFTVLSGLKYFRSTRTSLRTNTGRKQVSSAPLSVTKISQDEFHQVRYDRVYWAMIGSNGTYPSQKNSCYHAGWKEKPWGTDWCGR